MYNYINRHIGRTPVTVSMSNGVNCSKFHAVPSSSSSASLFNGVLVFVTLFLDAAVEGLIFFAALARSLAEGVVLERLDP